MREGLIMVSQKTFPKTYDLGMAIGIGVVMPLGIPSADSECLGWTCG